MLIDSNIIIYSLVSDSPKNKKAKIFLKSQKQLFFAQQNIFESLRVITHKKFSNPFTSNEAIIAINQITQYATIISPISETSEIAIELIKKYKISGSEIFDAYLVATAISNEIYQVATDNVKDLGKYREIEVFNPFI